VAAHLATGEEIGAVYALIQMATAQAHLQDPRATDTCRQALALAEAHDERLVRAHAQWTLGYDAWIRGDLKEAAAMIRAALENEHGFNDYIRVALMLEQLAWVTAAGGNHKQAGELLGAAGALWRDVDTPVSAFGPHMAAQHARCEDDVVRALGPAAYQAALAEGGRNHGPDEAIAYALRTAPEPPAARPASSPLTPREHDVAALVAAGLSNQQVASALHRSPHTVERHVHPPSVHAAHLTRAQEFIETNLGDSDLSPETIARAVFLSERRLHTLFRDSGTSVSRYVMSRRLDRAYRDLTDPGLAHVPISDIATRAGFKSPKHFSRTFRDKFGICPREHRNSADRTPR
jgi:AraC-like DNA-binding protein